MSTLSQQEIAVVMRLIDEVSAVAPRVKGSVDGIADAVEKKTSKWNAAKTAVSAVVGVMTGALMGALSSAARAAADDAASVERLTVAVENVGEAYDVQAPLIEQRIALGQRLAFSDDMTRDALSRLVPMSQSVSHALELEAIAMDLARGKSIDLGTAADIVGKVANGNVAILTRYGIVLDKGATATEALAALQAKFGSQAERHGATQSAAIFRMKDAISEWTESIGASLGPAQTFIALLPGLSQGMSIAGAAIGVAAPAVMHLTGALWAMIPAAVGAAAPFIAVAAAAGLVVWALWEVAQTIGVVIDNWDKVTWAVGRAVDDLGRSARRLVDDFGALGHDIVEGLWRGIQDNWHLVLGPVGGLVRGLVDTVRNILGSHSPSDIMIDEGENFAVGMAQGIVRRSKDVVRAARLMAAEGIEGTKSELMARAQEAEDAGRAIGAAVATGIGNGIRASTAIDEAIQKRLDELTRLRDQAIIGMAGAVPVSGTFGPGGTIVAGPPTPRGVIVGGIPGQTRYDPSTGTIYNADGSVGHVPPGSAPKAWVPTDRGPIPVFHRGGVMPWDGLAMLQRGERVLSRDQGGGDVVINFNAPVYGMADFADTVKAIVRDTASGGGFRGVLVTGR